MKLDQLYSAYKKCDGIETDTRKPLTNKLFIALKGENFNANTFVQQAFDGGALYAIVDEPDAVKNENCFLVNNCLVSLQALAQYHRQQLDTTIICIGGSNGKTTTKELVSNVLSSTYNTFSTPGNYNNHIGVPLSLLAIQPQIEYAVIEIGANHKHEHELLMQIAQPDFALITNNGKDHLEGFGSIEGVIEANKEIYEYQENFAKPVFVNADDDVLVANSTGMACIYYSCKNNPIADCNVEIIHKFPFIKVEVDFGKQKTIIESHLFGSFQAYNIAVAACIGNYFDVPISNIKKAIEAYQPKNNRTQVLSWHDNKIILDAYNANPSSVEAVLNDFIDLKADKKAIILGDMLELGEKSINEHQLMIERITSAKLDLVLLIGSEFGKTDKPKKFIWFKNRTDAKTWLDENPIKGYTILIKGSRGLALEKMLD